MFFATDIASIFHTTKDKQAMNSMFLTLGVSFAATIVSAVFAVPLAYILARTSFRFKNVILGIINIPIVIPHSAAGIAILGLISRETSVGKAAQFFGLNFIDNPLGIAIAMAYVSVPFLIVSAMNGFVDIPERIEQAAFTMGASKIKVFFRIALPLSKSSVFTGMILMFSRGISEFGAVIMVAYFPTITPILIYDRFTSFGLANARPIAVIFILVCLSIFFITYLFSNRKLK
jgi:molybdate/tungstate transport system permease protein